MKQIYVKTKSDYKIKKGYPWVFSNEIAPVADEYSNGEIVDLFDSNKSYLGCGFYNKNSLIAFRLLHHSKIDDLKAFIRNRISEAMRLRTTIYPQRQSYRLVFSESDFLPGLIIDKYNSTFVLQVNSAGIEKLLPLIVEILVDDFNALNIFTKNENHFRNMEGLSETDSILKGEMGEELINDGEIDYLVDFSTGQKTGFFFDQSDNRFFIERFTRGKKVLDAFCNTGGFGLHALKGGANEVTFLDSSQPAIRAVEKNYSLNQFNQDSEFIVNDVFDYFEKNSETFDIVMIDPPAFAKSKKNIMVALKGYEKLNRLALSKVRNEGYLVTSSCSYHINEQYFLGVIADATKKEGKRLKLIYRNGASMDHPLHPQMAESSYLKFFVYQVNRR